MEENQFKKVVACLERSYINFNNENYKKRIFVAKSLLEAGFAEKLLDNTFIKNIINLLAPFVQNKKIKESIKLLQEGLKEEKEIEIQKVKGKPFKKTKKWIKSNIDEKDIDNFEVYETPEKHRIEFFFNKAKQNWNVIDFNDRPYTFQYKINAELKLKELLNNENFIRR
jgi:hypothetical protein